MRKKQLIIVGDRVLIKPDDKERTDVGLFLPKSAINDQPIQQGVIIKVGPGIPLGTYDEDDNEPWRRKSAAPKYFPMQAEERDIAIYFRRAGIEVKYEGVDYLVVPQGAILLLQRDGGMVVPDHLPDELGQGDPSHA